MQWNTLKRMVSLTQNRLTNLDYITAQTNEVELIKNFFSKCDHIRSFPQIWSHLLKKSSIENFIFYAEHFPEAVDRRCSTY